MRIALLLLTLAAIVSSCYQFTSHPDDDLRATPVTNGPNVVPQSGMPMMQSMPY
ncbi:hypothetical protein NEPTK9_001191 [Candidatus Neptunochlamydia vexilliferae]|uniref:Lipoprotein n=1 Tax=Candidatus Neptunichlamydia vexilliferae TaxID=1651774 RepID=A0ABS0AZX0_9BACT|nr:hypothetical protein [Candidatus Neptunochlamydia vexilliferae]